MSYKIYIQCNNCGHEGVVEIADGNEIADKECPICKCKKLARSSFDTGYRIDRVEGVGYKSPEEIALVYNPDYLDFQKGVEATRELYRNYVRLAEDQSLPAELLSCGFGCEELLKDWRKVIL